MMRRAGAWLRRRAEDVAAAMLAVMFAAFLLQIGFRYLFNLPVGWTSELTLVMWLWLVLWGAAFVTPERGEIRFDILTGMVSRRVRIAMAMLGSAAFLVLYAASLPASYRYVAFMKVEKSSYMKIPMDWLYAIYLVFLVAILVRYLWILGQLARGREPAAPDPSSTASGL